jgi:arylformamidase
MSKDMDYSVTDFIVGGSEYPERWATEAHEFRALEQAMGRAQLNISYGSGTRSAYDLFLPSGRPEGLVVFVHGGYWMEFDRRDWSQFSEGATLAGWAVAIPSYTLTPDTSVAEITRQVARAIETAALRIPGPIILTGHSAGGHLVARMANADGPLAPEIAARLARVVPISPIADLRPLMETAMNVTLRLDAAEALAESPALHARTNVPVHVWVGADERPVFLEQARQLADAWAVPLTIEPGRHHFDVIDGLRDPGSPLMQTLFRG